MKNGILHSLVIICIAAATIACERDYQFGFTPESEDFALDVSYNSKVDVLWVVDNSSSMLQHQQRLSSQVGAFMDTLDASKMDYHVGVITTSMGGQNPNGGRLIGEPKYITRGTKNNRKILQERFVVGQDGSDNERGLESLLQATDPSRMEIEYNKFIRDDSLLVVIFLTDEDDHSTNVTPDQVVAHFDSLKRPFKDGSRSWVAHFIGVEAISGSCSTFNQYSDPGEKYLSIVAETGGVSDSICNVDLRAALTKIRRQIVQKMTDFPLDRKPQIETIKVYFNGLLIPQSDTDGWSYIADLNVVRFHGIFIPSAEDKLKVDYTPSETK